MTRPGRDVRVSPVEELTLEAKVEDDFGVVRHGLSYTLAGGEPIEVVLGSPKRRDEGGQGRAPPGLRGAQGRSPTSS